MSLLGRVKRAPSSFSFPFVANYGMTMPHRSRHSLFIAHFKMTTLQKICIGFNLLPVFNLQLTFCNQGALSLTNRAYVHRI